MFPRKPLPVNKHLGSSFDDFLKEEGIFADVSESARKKINAIFQQMEWDEQQRQVKEQLKHHIEHMFITDVDYGELSEDGTPVVLTITGQPTF